MKILSFKNIKTAYVLRYEPEQYAYFARAYWRVLLIITLLLMCVSVAYGAWQFLAPDSAFTTSEPAQQGIVGFKREQLKRVVDVFEKRRTDFEAMMRGE